MDRTISVFPEAGHFHYSFTGIDWAKLSNMSRQEQDLTGIGAQFENTSTSTEPNDPSPQLSGQISNASLVQQVKNDVPGSIRMPLSSYRLA